MLKSNKIQKVIMVVLSFYLIVIIAYITINFSMKKSSDLDGKDLKNAKVVLNEDGENGEITTEDTLIVLNMKFNSNKDTISKEEKAGDKYNNLTKSEIEAKFKNLGFTIDKFTKEKVVLNKESFYLPNKYVIGIKENKICIYKTDEYGDLKVESQDDIFKDMDANKLPDKEREFLFKGHVNYQFDTKEEAISAVDDYREFYK